jgi:hypothetical protein
MWRRLIFIVVALPVVSLLPGCAGQRYIEVDVERDGVPTLHTEYGVSDSLDAAAIWSTLQGQSFAAVGTVKSEPEDPEKAVIKGKIRMVIRHVKNEMATAKINELRLLRDPGSSDRWKLAPGEVERTAQAAAL